MTPISQNRIVTLADMIQFDGSKLVNSTYLSAYLASMLPNLSQVGVGKLVEMLNDLRAECVLLGLDVSLRQIDRTLVQIKVGNMNDVEHCKFLLSEVSHAFTMIKDELQSRAFFSLQPTERKYFEDSQFAPTARERFQDVVFDMDEAGKCFALDRATACVFHLMRVTEYALQEIGRLVGIKQERPDWGPIIKKIDAELKLPYNEREFKGSGDLLSNISAHLNAIKTAWRHRTMHTGKKHTMEEAKEIYNSVRALMRYLGENLPE